MKKIFALILFLTVCSTNVFAANFAVITSPPTMLSLAIVLVGIGCLVLVTRVLSLLRGGLLFKSWQIFLTAFIVLVVSQVANLVNDFEIFALPTYIVPAIVTLAVGLFLYGVFETKKTLE